MKNCISPVLLHLKHFFEKFKKIIQGSPLLFLSGLSGGFSEGVGGDFEAKEFSFSKKFLLLLARSRYFILAIRANIEEYSLKWYINIIFMENS